MKNVLIVDDDPDILSLVPEFLADLPVHCRIASGAKTALQIIGEGQIDIVISDINMPDMDGLTLMQTLQNQGFKGPVVLMTGIVDINIMYLAWKLGTFDFLDKPIDIEKLLSIVTRALKIESSPQIPKISRTPALKKVAVNCEISESVYACLQAYCRYNKVDVATALETMIKKCVDDRLSA